MFNGLLLNPSKSEVMWAGTSSQLRTASTYDQDLKIADIHINPSSSIKVIGVIFDNQLTFSPHISNLCQSVNYHLRALTHIRRSLDTHTANMLATSIIGSRVDYCNSLFSGITDHNILRLQRLQNRAAKIVTNSKGRVSTAPLLRQLHWLPIPNRIDFKIAVLTFKVLTSQQPAYLNSLLTPYTSTRSLRSSDQHLLSVPRCKTVFQSRAFSVYAPKLWNRLPQSLRDLAFNTQLQTPLNPTSSPFPDPSSNLSVFKTNLKTFLFDCPPKFLVP